MGGVRHPMIFNQDNRKADFSLIVGILSCSPRNNSMPHKSFVYIRFRCRNVARTKNFSGSNHKQSQLQLDGQKAISLNSIYISYTDAPTYV
ncbi:Protein of unknown function [Pyronema omphalodes CBS 100304]|uniref:Uncharacterized protein n=1 Tax=Pyronema omphalodes (strain CBS 100304) TaxID=1076935 RepID=U4L9B1_PYROM|nr:Protein of unknown function [Pyronema omphalodes CBS 100304]